jgi:Fe-S cluster assembly iron-binding protein IscA
MLVPHLAVSPIGTCSRQVRFDAHRSGRVAQQTFTQPKYSVALTSAAAQKVTQLLEGEKPGLALRVQVHPGGCSGLRYQLFFADEYAALLAKELAGRADEGFAEADSEEEAAQRAAMISAGESVVWFERFAVLIDEKSGPLLNGGSIDFTDTLQKQGFTISNPNAQGSCACGDSFH